MASRSLSPAAPSRRKPAPRRISHENRIFVYALAAGLPAVVATVWLALACGLSSKSFWTLLLGIGSCWLGFSLALRGAVIRPLQTLSNMQAALREGDFSIRARGARFGDSLGELMYELNSLSEALREQRLGELEATALLSKVMAEIDVAIFAFDTDQCLRLVNRSGERLVDQTNERALGRTAEDLELADYLGGDPVRTVERSFPGGPTGRWGIRRSTFRQGGVPHQLLVISDLSRALREEERQAWQRIVRVLGHELNNSLAPIKSIAQSLEEALRHDSRAPDWEEDVRRGLKVIGDRSEALTRFMKDYARLARLPRPHLQALQLDQLVQRVE